MHTPHNHPPPPPPTHTHSGHLLDDAGVVAALKPLLAAVDVQRGDYGAGYYALLAHPDPAVRCAVRRAARDSRPRSLPASAAWRSAAAC